MIWVTTTLLGFMSIALLPIVWEAFKALVGIEGVDSQTRRQYGLSFIMTIVAIGGYATATLRLWAWHSMPHDDDHLALLPGVIGMANLIAVWVTANVKVRQQLGIHGRIGAIDSEIAVRFGVEEFIFSSLVGAWAALVSLPDYSSPLILVATVVVVAGFLSFVDFVKYARGNNPVVGIIPTFIVLTKIGEVWLQAL
jgi:hypothetical protein